MMDPGLTWFATALKPSSMSWSLVKSSPWSIRKLIWRKIVSWCTYPPSLRPMECFDFSKFLVSPLRVNFLQGQRPSDLQFSWESWLPAATPHICHDQNLGFSLMQWLKCINVPAIFAMVWTKGSKAFDQLPYWNQIFWMVGWPPSLSKYRSCHNPQVLFGCDWQSV